MQIKVSTPRTNDCKHDTTEVSIEDVYLIWSFEHNAWWGPSFSGYNRELLGAGLYTREAAEAESGQRYAGTKRDEEARRLIDVLPKRTPRDGNTVYSILDGFIASLVSLTPEATNG